jgi:mono/diheme cytochrome c family protein
VGRTTVQRAARIAFVMMSISLYGCRQDMQDQPKTYPQRGSQLFADHRSARQQPAGTVARSQSVSTSYFNSGLVDGQEGDGLPIALNLDVLRRGQERFNIYCSPCHSRVGNGRGAIVERGFRQAANFHSERLRQAPLGHFFRVMTNGFGAMPNYAVEIDAQDRWAIVAYIRALQLSQNAATSDVPQSAVVHSLQQVSQVQGLGSGFLDPWLNPPRGSQSPLAFAPKSEAVSGNSNAKAAGPANPVKAPGASPTPASAAGSADAGKEIYLKNCSMCHQPTRTGLPPLIPSLKGITFRLSENAVRGVLATGKPEGTPPMPPFPNLSPADIDQLYRFLKTP